MALELPLLILEVTGERADHSGVAGCPQACEIPTLLDEQVLADLHEDFASTGDLAELVELIRGFLDRGAAQLERVSAAVALADVEAVRQSAHKLKGSSRTLGASLAGAVAGAIEEAAEAGDVLAARRLLPELEATFRLSRSALTDAIDAIGALEGEGPLTPVTPVADGPSLRVLIADDEPIALAVLRAMIERFGHDCTVVMDGVAAMAAYERVRPDIVVSDWMMPGIDGLALARRVQAMGGATPYFVLLSASGQRQDVRDEVGDSVDAVLSKPVREDELRAVLALAARRSA